MALIFDNISKCPICKNVLNQNQEYIIFPPLISNTKDSLFIFNDNGVHTKCLVQHPFGKMALKCKDKYYEQIPRQNLSCSINGQLISDPKNIFALGLLTSNENEELSKFNFLIFNKENLKDWTAKEEFLKVASEFLIDGKWNSLTTFNYLDYIINELNEYSR